MLEQQAIEENKKYYFLKYKQIIKKILKMSGLRLKTVERMLAEYKTKETVSSSNKKKKWKTVIKKTDDFDQNPIRQEVHNFWFNCEISTLNKILVAVNEDKDLPNFSKTLLCKILKHLNFKYLKKILNSALIKTKKWYRVLTSGIFRHNKAF